MSDIVTYARAGGPPDNWRHLEVVDLDTGETVPNVHEVDTEAGYVVVEALAHPTAKTYRRVRLEGRFQINTLAGVPA